MLHAAKHGHLADVDRLLAAGATDFDGAMRRAAGGGHLAVVARLLAAGATDFDGAMRCATNAGHLAAVAAGATDFDGAWYSAANGDHLAVVERLLAAGATDFQTALLWAAYGGHLAVVERLLAAGATNIDEAIQYAAGGGHLAAVERLLAAGATNFDEAMKCAAEGGHLAAVERLLVAGATDFDQAMRHAANGGHLAVVEHLLIRKRETRPSPSTDHTCNERDTMTFDSSVPIVDMAECDLATGRVSPAFAAAFVGALGTCGFVGVTNTGTDAAVLRAGYAASEWFFHQSPEFKARFERRDTHGQRGFVPGETAKGSAAKDNKAFFHVGPGYAPLQNEWPSEEFGKGMLGMLAELEKLQTCLLRAVETGLGCVPAGRLVETARTGDNLLRALHYPKPVPGEMAAWAAAHTDIDLLTILPSASAPGLEVCGAGGEWHRVVVPEGAVIVNAGDMLQSLTNGRVVSSLHRVVAGADAGERFSIVYFVHARPTDDVGPMPECCVDEPARYAAMTQKDMLAVRLRELGLQRPVEEKDIIS